MRIVTTFVGTALAATLWGGCLKKSAFNCADDTACGIGGVCEPQGFCSVENSACAGSGRAFSETAGNGLANTCVGGGTPIDAPEDFDGQVVPPDMFIPPAGCPDAAYVMINNGQVGHKYKLISAAISPATTWSNQHNLNCLPNGYLAIPDNQAELAALEALVGGTNYWVGVSDRVTDTQIRDVFNNAYVGAGINITGNVPSKDCALATNNMTLDFNDCDDAEIAVCECDE